MRIGSAGNGPGEQKEFVVRQVGVGIEVHHAIAIAQNFVVATGSNRWAVQWQTSGGRRRSDLVQCERQRRGDADHRMLEDTSAIEARQARVAVVAKILDELR